jgi:signal transduction histidine kinase/HAMP domain-containing protein
MLVMTVAMASLVVQYRGVSQAQELITDGYLPLAKSVARLTTGQARIDNDVRRLLVDEARPSTGRQSAAMIFADQLEQEVVVAREHGRKSYALATDPEEVAALNRVLVQLDRIANLFADYRVETTRIVALAEDSDPTQVDRSQLLRLSSQLGDEVQTLTQQVDGRIAHLTAATEAARRQATLVALGLTIVAIGVASVLLALVLYALQPIASLTDQVQRLAAGDYSGRVEVRGDDEISVLAEEFNTMVGALQARDATLVERAEELNTLSRYLASVVDSLQEGLLVLEDDQITLANPAARELWGVDQGGPVPDRLATLITGGERRVETEDPSGRLHEVRLTRFGRDGWVVSAADITDATLAKQRLARSERLALVGQMLAQITHEVRNPLNALSLNTEMLGDELAAFDPDRSTEGWEILALIASEIERLTAVTGHYLQLARRPPAKLEPVDLGALVQDVTRLLEPDLDAKGITLHLDLDPLEPVQADGNQLRQALLNVLRNAAEAGASHLELRLRRDGPDVAIGLRDDGPGMADVERATDPFYSTKASGTGLGLAITRQILEDHDGAVRVHSTPGQGTDIALVFPHRPGAPPP